MNHRQVSCMISIHTVDLNMHGKGTDQDQMTYSPSCTAQWVTYDPGVRSLIPVRYHTLVEIDYEINAMVILLTSADTRRVVVNVHKVMVNRLIKLALEKSVVR